MSASTQIRPSPISDDERSLLFEETSRGLQGEPSGLSLPSFFLRRFSSRGILFFVILSINFVFYFDRGALVGSLMAIRTDDQIRGSAKVLSDSRSGVLVSGFIAGYTLSCPIFAALVARLGFKRIILASMAIWAVTCIGAALSWNYYILLVNRLLTGVGEAAFISFAMTTTDNIASPRHRTTWIGAFYAMIPLGMSVGIAIGGVVSGWSPFFLGLAAWRVVFLAEAVLACPVFVLFALVPSRYYQKHATEAVVIGAKDRQREEREGERGIPPVEDDAASLSEAFRGILQNLDYAWLITGYCVLSFVATALAVWGVPTLVQGPLQLDRATAAALIGGSTALGGLGGALLGGLLVDVLGGSHGDLGLANCLLFNQVMLALAIPCGFFAFLQVRLWLFLFFFIIAMFALFLLTAPVNACILTIVSPAIRPYAIAISVFFLHIVGDFPSPVFVGMLSDRFGRHCMLQKDEKSCQADPNERCNWLPVSTRDHAWECSYELQLRNALLITFSLLFITLLCWHRVYRRARARILVVDGTFLRDVYS